jgi:hypothetical protein
LPANDHRDLARLLVGEDVLCGLGKLDARIAIQKLEDLRKRWAIGQVVPNVGTRAEISVNHRFGGNRAVPADNNNAEIPVRILGVGARDVGSWPDLRPSWPLRQSESGAGDAGFYKTSTSHRRASPSRAAF